MDAIKLLQFAHAHLTKVSALIQPKPEVFTLEEAFIWNHANNIVVHGADVITLAQVGSISGPSLLARTMLESAFMLSAAAKNSSFMREKLDYDLRENTRRLQAAERELGVDLSAERGQIRDHLYVVRKDSEHSRDARLDTLNIAKKAKLDCTIAYRVFYYVLSFHVHADWFAFMHQATTPGLPIKALNAAAFACALATTSLLDYFPQISTSARCRKVVKVMQHLNAYFEQLKSTTAPRG